MQSYQTAMHSNKKHTFVTTIILKVYIVAHIRMRNAIYVENVK